MLAFITLLNRLYYARSTKQKMAMLLHYLKNTQDPDRGWAVAVLSGQARLPGCRSKMLKEMITERVDPVLFSLSYDYVGELSETIAHLWPVTIPSDEAQLPSLSELFDIFSRLSPSGVKEKLSEMLSMLRADQRWGLIKLCTGGLRIGMSARNIKHVLADFGACDVSHIEEVWHAMSPPYVPLFTWLEGRSEKPSLKNIVRFYPVMLAHPVNEEELHTFAPSQWQLEYKYDGIRVQHVSTSDGCALFTRTGEDISASFPEVLMPDRGSLVLDAELLVVNGNDIKSFNALQQRLNKKRPSSRLRQDYPCKLMIYDILLLDGEDLRHQSLRARRQQLEHWFRTHAPNTAMLSPLLTPSSPQQDDWLNALYQQACNQPHVEGVMLKRLDSPYLVGRVRGHWYKWKRQPLTVDAVIMYAQRGHGKRSSYYSDFTFGAWHEGQLLPIGKAYSGFSDDELVKLDRWVRRNTIGRFGPVKEVQKTLVVEVACDALYHSTRHKSGVAMRFPRIHRIRWDKPATEADALSTVMGLIK